jgi:hypothetical protein
MQEIHNPLNDKISSDSKTPLTGKLTLSARSAKTTNIFDLPPEVKAIAAA